MTDPAQRAQAAEASLAEVTAERDHLKSLHGNAAMDHIESETRRRREIKRAVAAEASCAVLREALEKIAAHVVISEGEFPDDNCDWHCAAELRSVARAALVVDGCDPQEQEHGGDKVASSGGKRT